MAKNPINARLEKAVDLHQAGQFAEAEKLYDQILALDRANPDALNLKGIIANTQGRHGEALALFERAATVLPNFPEFPFNRGLALAALGRTEEALQSYLRAIALNPAYADAHLNAGLLLHTMGRTADAVAAFRIMTQRAPGDPRGFYNLGVCLEKSLPAAAEAERPSIAEEARAAFTRAAALDPNNPEVHFAFANLHSFLGEYKGAIERLKTALNLNPAWSESFRAEVLSDLGEYMRKDGDLAGAIGTQRQALTLRPNDKIIRFNLAAALYDSEMREEARTIYEELLKTDPDFVKPYVNLANIYRDEGRLDEALALLEEAISRAPTVHAYTTMAAVLSDKGWLITALMIHDKAISMEEGVSVQARFNRAVTLLTLGQFASGWPDYDLRFLLPSEKTPGRPVPPPYWQGEDISTKKLFIWTEQGIGDETMYAGMIPEMIPRAASCVIEVSRRMVPIFKRSFPQAKVVARVGRELALAEAACADVQISAASLGRFLRQDISRFPRHAGYLKADPDKAAHLRRRYQALANGRPIVGIAWKSARPLFGVSKSAPLAEFGAILEVAGVLFVNLQYGDCGAEIADAHTRYGVEIHQDSQIDPIADLDAFFAQVAAMDLVISTSNSTVHVAGAMNVPTWLMLQPGRGALWYWFLRREDCPWYPSVRIFRASGADPSQPWYAEPVSKVGAELSRWVRAAQAPAGG